MNATVSPGVAYDATAILGFGHVSDKPLPEAAPGEIVISYGGWSLQRLCASNAGTKLMYQQDWYSKYPWSRAGLPWGLYRLRVPVPDSNDKTFAEQERLLPHGDLVAPVVLVATALIAHRLQTSEDVLKNDWTRCKEQTAGSSRVVLGWSRSRLHVYERWSDNRFDYTWVSSARTS